MHAVAALAAASAAAAAALVASATAAAIRASTSERGVPERALSKLMRFNKSSFSFFKIFTCAVRSSLVCLCRKLNYKGKYERYYRALVFLNNAYCKHGSNNRKYQAWGIYIRA